MADANPTTLRFKRDIHSDKGLAFYEGETAIAQPIEPDVLALLRDMRPGELVDEAWTVFPPRLQRPDLPPNCICMYICSEDVEVLEPEVVND